MPAGGIKPDETPEVAALREAAEETGLSGLRVVRKVGESQYDMAPYRHETQHRHFPLLELDEPTPRRCVSTEDDPDDGSAPKRCECCWPLTQGHVLVAGQGVFLGRT